MENMNSGSLQKDQNWSTAKVYVQKIFFFFIKNVVLDI